MPPELLPNCEDEEVHAYYHRHHHHHKLAQQQQPILQDPKDEVVPTEEQNKKNVRNLLLASIESDDDDEATKEEYLLCRAFPITKAELPVFGSLSLLNFFIIIVLTLTRDLKDTLVVTYMGAESIAFLKIYCVLPAACLQVMWYNTLGSCSYFCGTNKKDKLWYATGVPFFMFFVIYCTLIHPYADALHVFKNDIDDSSSSSSSIFIKILNNWTVAAFYVAAELYSSVSVGILFWKLANDIVTDPGQAKRFYPLFSYMSSAGPIVAGQYAVLYASKASTFQKSLDRIALAIALSGVVICVLHQFLVTHYFVATPSSSSTLLTSKNNSNKKKSKITMKDSVTFLACSEYLRHIAALVIGYGVMYNFIEISWKSLVKMQYNDPIDYQRFMGNFSSIVGLFTFVVIFCGSHLLNRCGWRVGAMATPLIMAVVAVPFFFSVMFMDIHSSDFALKTSVTVATCLVLLSRSCKYGLFDATTQLSYLKVPLDDESKTRGKAAIDVLGSRIGKSGASLIQQGFVLVFGSILDAAPAVFIVYYAVALSWVTSVYKLGNLFSSNESAAILESDQKKKQ